MAVEKLVLDLSNPLLKSVEYYDEDSENFINDLYVTTVNITIAYSILNILFYFFVLYRQIQHLQFCLISEMRLAKLFIKEDTEAGSQPATGQST